MASPRVDAVGGSGSRRGAGSLARVLPSLRGSAGRPPCRRLRAFPEPAPALGIAAPWAAACLGLRGLPVAAKDCGFFLIEVKND